MKFGVREITDVTFKALQSVKIGEHTFQKGEPILYIDTAKTSTIEGSSTTVYATGGRGNARLIAWEGEKTLTFTVEDALLSTMGLKVLTGAGLFPNLGTEDGTEKAMVHRVEKVFTNTDGEFTLKDKDLAVDNQGNLIAPMFILPMKSGSITVKEWRVVAINKDLMTYMKNPVTEEWMGNGSYPSTDYFVSYNSILNKIMINDKYNGIEFSCSFVSKKSEENNNIMFFKRDDDEEKCYSINETILLKDIKTATISQKEDGSGYYKITVPDLVNETVFVDYYVAKKNIVTELSIDADTFGGYYYVEGKTVFRRESDGKDLDATLTFPKVKIQSNITLNFAGSGDPATMTFTMDAMPACTMFERSKEVLCAIQIINED